MKCQQCGKSDCVTNFFGDSRKRENLTLCFDCLTGEGQPFTDPLTLIREKIQKSSAIPEKMPKKRRFSFHKNSPPDPALVFRFMKERLEALILDERYEEAGKLAVQIKDLKKERLMQAA